MNIHYLETQYLKAKVAYYEGNPIMTDAAFDVLEKQLKDAGSKVIEQVGAKRKDFDFPHPHVMLSLAKIQTESVNGVTNYQKEAFEKWLKKTDTIVFDSTWKHIKQLWGSPKFDGNAINVIYNNGPLQAVLTRGTGKAGKDITDRFRKYLPQTIDVPGVVEIRCECVINQKLFDKKYFGSREEEKYANARNFVAGVLGKDEYSLEKVADLTLIPVAYLIDGVQTDLNLIPKGIFGPHFQHQFAPRDYVSFIQSMEQLRTTFDYPLDGVVIATDYEFRPILGQNEHDPEWAIAIKFVPDEVVTNVVGIEWSMSKTGELNPVVLLNPVELAGTIVKRASGYNAGYIINNKIGADTFVAIAKAGDIIPEIQNITVQSAFSFGLPSVCPYCGSALDFDGIHLTCDNDSCVGKIAKKLASASAALDLKGVGGKTLEPFAKEFKNMYELMKWVLVCGHTGAIERFGIPFNSRSHEIFVNAFKNIKSLSYEQVIISLGFENVGKKLSLQIAKEHCGLTPDYTGLEKALVAKLHEPTNELYIKTAVSTLESLGVVIDKPKVAAVNPNAVYVCMTGSPKDFGFKTKGEFIAQFPNAIEVDIKDKNCQYLITDDMNSTSSKMKAAEKKGIKIVTYGNFKI